MRKSFVLAAMLVLVGASCARMAEGAQSKARAKSGPSKQRAKPPIKKDAVFDALRIGGLNTTELVTLVKERGVDFRMTDEDERELRAAGARPLLIEAIRESYRAYRGRRDGAAVQTPSAAEPVTRAVSPPEFKDASVFIFYTSHGEVAARGLESSLRASGVTKVSAGVGLGASGRGTIVYGSGAYDFAKWLSGNFNTLASFPLIDTRSASAGVTANHVVITLW